MAFALGLFAVGPVLAGPVSVGASPSATYEQIDAYVQRQMDRLRIPGVALAIVEGDTIAHLLRFSATCPGSESQTRWHQLT